MHTDLIASPPELCQNIGGQHPRITPCDIDIQVLQAAQVVQSVIKRNLLPQRIVMIPYLVGHLNLIYEKIEPLFLPLGNLTDLRRKLQRVTVFYVSGKIQLNGNDLFFLHAVFQQVSLVYDFQQIGFPATPDSGNDFD